MCAVTYKDEKSPRPWVHGGERGGIQINGVVRADTFKPLSDANDKITIDYYSQVDCRGIFRDFWPEAVCTRLLLNVHVPTRVLLYTRRCTEPVSCTEIKFLPTPSSKFFWIAYTIFMYEYGHVASRAKKARGRQPDISTIIVFHRPVRFICHAIAAELLAVSVFLFLFEIRWEHCFIFKVTLPPSATTNRHCMYVRYVRFNVRAGLDEIIFARKRRRYGELFLDNSSGFASRPCRLGFEHVLNTVYNVMSSFVGKSANDWCSTLLNTHASTTVI